MRNFLLAVPVLALGFLAGCVWPPDSTPTGYNNNYNYYEAGFFVHRISQRSISGSESLATLVYPPNPSNGYPYYGYYYPDSIRYIIVNGDTAYRHPTYVLPATYDSAAPYRVDGTANFVTLVYPSFTISDTSYEQNLSAQITSPAYGDTILRTTDALFSYQTTNSNYYYSYPSGIFQITDSNYYYSEPLSYSTSGTVDFPLNDMATFRAGTLWADLGVTWQKSDGTNVSSGPPYYQFSMVHQVELDRIVAYPLQ